MTKPLRALPLVFLGVCATLVAVGCGDDDALGLHAVAGSSGAEAGAAGDSGGAPMNEGGSGATPEGGAAGATNSCGAVDVAALARGTWDPQFSIAGVTGHDGITPSVYDFAIEPDGSVLATGRFAYYKGKWQALHETWEITPPDDGFSALAVNDEGVLALATGDSFGDRDGEIWIDEAGKQTVVASFVGQVRSLSWFGGKLYAAGAFKLAPSSGGFENLAVWDGSAWSEPPGGAADGPVLELLVSGGALYVGGAFHAIGGLASDNVASFDGTAWTALSLEGALAVYALARTEQGELYAGGALGTLEAAGGVVKRVGEQWQIVGGGLAQFQTRGVVSDLVAHDGVVDATGCGRSGGRRG